jgi:hypothetical protein
VVVRFNYSVTLLDGSMATAHGFMHCRLADGKIIAQDVMTNPDMGPVFAPLFASPAECWLGHWTAEATPMRRA